MAKVQKTDAGWTAEGVEGVFTSREKARQALKVQAQEEAEATYEPNIRGGASEQLSASVAPTFRDEERALNNYRHMAETTTGPAQRFWLDKLAAVEETLGR